MQALRLTVESQFITDPGRVFGANDRIRFGLIGCGDRGQEDLQAALTCTNVECVALADVYTRRLDETQRIAPQAKTYRDFRQMLDDKSVDAVVIVTPQHQHALNFVPAIKRGRTFTRKRPWPSIPTTRGACGGHSRAPAAWCKWESNR